jgi:hypothetical protein
MEAQTAQLFSTVPRSNYLGFFPQGKKPDIRKAAKFLGFKKEEVARATGVPTESVRYDTRTPERMRERLREIATICELVAGYFNGDIDKTALWFKVSNPMLGEMSPRDMIRLGRYKKLLQFVLNARQAEGAAAGRRTS